MFERWLVENQSHFQETVQDEIENENEILVTLIAMLHISIKSAGDGRTMYTDEMAIFIQSGRYLSLSV